MSMRFASEILGLSAGIVTGKVNEHAIRQLVESEIIGLSAGIFARESPAHPGSVLIRRRILASPQAFSLGESNRRGNLPASEILGLSAGIATWTDLVGVLEIGVGESWPLRRHFHGDRMTKVHEFIPRRRFLASPQAFSRHVGGWGHGHFVQSEILGLSAGIATSPSVPSFRS